MDSIRPFRGRLLWRLLGRRGLCRLCRHAIPAAGLCRPDDPRETAFRRHARRLRTHQIGQADAGLCRNNLGALHVHLPVRRVHCDREGDGNTIHNGAADSDGIGGNRHRGLHLQRGTSRFPSYRSGASMDHPLSSGGLASGAFRRRYRGADRRCEGIHA